MPLANPVSEKIENLSYNPGLQDSGDLEAATKTINANAEPGVADYSAPLTVPAPSDGRIAVTRLGVRLQVTIDSWAGGGTILNYRIKRDGTSVGTGQIATGAATGVKLTTHGVATGTLTGAATYEVFLWVDQGSCVVSLCQVWAGVGTGDPTANGGWGNSCLSVTHAGSIQIRGNIARQGSGNLSAYWMDSPTNANWESVLLNSTTATSATYNRGNTPSLILSPGTVYLRIGDGTVNTDLAYVNRFGVTLRS